MIFALISIVFGAVAQVLLKKGMTAHSLSSWHFQKVISVFLDPYVLAGLGLYGASMLLWLKVLSFMPLSKAYPMVSLGYVLTVLAGVFYLGEHPSIYKFGGLLLIVAGVILINQGN